MHVLLSRTANCTQWIMAGGTRRKKKKTTTARAVKEAMPCRIARAQGCVPYICKGRMAFISQIKTTLFGLWLRAQEDNRGKLERIKPFPLGAPSMGLLAHFTHREYSSVITQYARFILLSCASVYIDRCIRNARVWVEQSTQTTTPTTRASKKVVFLPACSCSPQSCPAPCHSFS